MDHGAHCTIPRNENQLAILLSTRTIRPLRCMYGRFVEKNCVVSLICYILSSIGFFCLRNYIHAYQIVSSVSLVVLHSHTLVLVVHLTISQTLEGEYKDLEYD